jgi:phosphoglycolate phosphatase
MTWPTAILFDLDGTLADSAPDIADALNALLQEQGLGEFPLEAVTKMVGGGVSLLIERALKAHGQSAGESQVGVLASRFLEIYSPRAAEKTRLFPGVREVLEHYHEEGIRLGICTNKPESVTRTILEALEVAHLFGSVIGGDTLPVKKPDPAPLLAALGHLGCDLAQGLMVGDSGADALAARAAALPVILVTYGYTRTPVHELDNDGLIDSFSQLPNAIKSLRNSRKRS